LVSLLALVASRSLSDAVYQPPANGSGEAEFQLVAMRGGAKYEMGMDEEMDSEI
jgi:hypothetical protein